MAAGSSLRLGRALARAQLDCRCLMVDVIPSEVEATTHQLQLEDPNRLDDRHSVLHVHDPNALDRGPCQE